MTGTLAAEPAPDPVYIGSLSNLSGFEGLRIAQSLLTRSHFIDLYNDCSNLQTAKWQIP